MFVNLDKNKYKNIYAHRVDGKESELLYDHCELTKHYYNKIVNIKNLDDIIDNLIIKIDTKYKDLIKELFINAVYMHDMGKINPSFQSNKMKNPDFPKTTDSSNHSMYGAEIYIEKFKQKILDIKNDKEYYKMIFILYNFAYHISKHHGGLDTIEGFAKRINKNEDDFIEHKLNNHFEFYILNKLLFSLLISSDYYATTRYMADLDIDNFGVFSDEMKKALKDKFNDYISKFKNPQGINKLRNDIFQETQNNLLKNPNKNIYYLEAPTGSGKTITSINLALQLLEKNKKINKLFYIFPFNTLVEQTKTVFDDIFGDDLKIEVINSISPIELEKQQEEDESNYTKSYINRLFFHSPSIITTHISLFNILFGTSKEDNFPLWQLANSVIILDEIQSYNNNLWWYMAEFFDKYASVLNIKIIIMSATLPKIDFFLQNKNNFVDLIESDKRKSIFENDYFKKRVDIDFSLLETKITLEQLEDFFKRHKQDYKKILFEFIKKQSAREFYNVLKSKYENVYELSGDDNKAYREFVINKSKTDKEIIIVATQVIEAGVDIDMDLGFKDTSTLDSEEQFMGRINRSCKKDNSKVYFFNMDDVNKIYKDDNRLGFDILKNKYQDILLNKNYNTYYRDVLSVIQESGLKYEEGVNTNIDNFKSMLQKLSYRKISKTMTLINSENFTLYFPFMLDISKFGNIKDFDNIDSDYLRDDKLNGQKVWDKFISLREIKGFAKSKIEYSKINLLMNFFTFNILKFQYSKPPTYFDEKVGGFYFIKDWKDFIDEENGKFNRVGYQEKCDNLFL